jgi:hypothetical protein
MNTLKKLERNLAALALAPLVNLESKERQRRLNERLTRLEQRQTKQNSVEQLR